MTTILVWTVAAALIAAGIAILRARKAREGGEAIRLVTSRYLGAKRFLTIVEVDGERLLLGLAGEQVSLVARLGGAHDDEHAGEEHP